MTMQRTQNWLTEELDTYLRSHVTTSFEWGVCDCCLFAADGILAMTGVDIAADFRGKYNDQASAMTTIHTVSGGITVMDAIAYCAAQHKLPEWVSAEGKPLPLMAKRGDLCAVSNDGNIIAGLVDLTGRYVACMSDTGFIRLPLSSIVRAWHVPVQPV